MGERVNKFVIKNIQKLPINTMLNLKTRFDRKRSLQNKRNVVYLGSMLFEVHTSIFVQLIIFEELSSFFVSCLPKSWWKMLPVSWSMSGKYSNVGYLSKCCFQLPRNYLEGTLNMAVIKQLSKCHFRKKMPWQWWKSFSSKRPFLPLD